MKKLILILCLFIFTGCTSQYDITINRNNTIKENFTLDIPNIEIDLNEFNSIDNFINTFEQTLETNEYSNYQKEVKKNPHSVVFYLNAMYNSFDSFQKSPLLSSIFQIDEITVVNDYTVLNLTSGYYYNMYQNSSQIDGRLTIKLDNEVLETNADKKDEQKGIYQWEHPITKKIYVKYSNRKFINKKSISNYMQYGIIVGVLCITICVFYIIKRKKEKNNQI